MDTTGRNFRVVDLVSQAEALAWHTQGWQKEDVLAWLRQYGKLGTGFYPDTYLFTAPSGLQAGFILREDGASLLILDHTTERLR